MNGPEFLAKKYGLAGAPETQKQTERNKKRSHEYKIPSTQASLVDEYLSRFDELRNRSDPDKTRRGIDALKSVLHKNHVIKELPESYFDSLRNSARARGEGDKFSEYTDEHVRADELENIQKVQRESIDSWIDQLAQTGNEFPTWAVYWAIRSMLKIGPYDKKTGSFSRRSAATTAPFPDLNQEALAVAIDYISQKIEGRDIANPVEVERNGYATNEKKVSDKEFQKIIDTETFSKYYAFIIEHSKSNKELFHITEGQWQTFSQGSDPSELVKRIQGQGTGWCITGECTAAEKLELGDIHVFFSRNAHGEPTIPRLAISMNKGNISEIRGVGPDQELDNFISPVLEVKLTEFASEGETYTKKTQDMEQMSAIEAKNNKKEALSIEDLRFLYELDQKIEGFGYEKDPRILEIKNTRNFLDDMKSVFNENQAGDSLAMKMIKAGEDWYVAEHLEKFTFQEFTHDDIAVKIIEAEEAAAVAEHLEKFNNLQETTALALIEHRNAAAVAEHLEKFTFQEFTHDDIAVKIIEAEEAAAAAVAEHLEKFTFQEFTHDDIAVKIIEAEEAAAVAEHLEKFNNLQETTALALIEHRNAAAVAEHLEKFTFQEFTHDDIAVKIIEAEEAAAVAVAEHLEKFTFQEFTHDYIAMKIIEAGEAAAAVAEHLEKFTFQEFTHDDIAVKIIEAEEAAAVAEHLEKFNNLQETTALALIEHGNAAAAVAKHLEKFTFQEFTHDDIAMKIIKAGWAWYVAKHLEKFTFQEFTHDDIAVKIIKAEEAAAAVAEHLEKFTFQEFTHDDIAVKIIEAGWALYLAKNLEKFNNLQETTALALIEHGNAAAAVAKHLEKFTFQEFTHDYIAMKIIEAGEAAAAVAEHLEKFTFQEFTHDDIAVKIIEAEEAAAVAEHLEKFNNLQETTALALIEHRNVAAVAEHLEKFTFQEFTHDDIAVKIIEAGWALYLAKHLEKFNNLQETTALALIEHGNAAVAVAEHLEKFTNLSTETLELIKQERERS